MQDLHMALEQDFSALCVSEPVVPPPLFPFPLWNLASNAAGDGAATAPSGQPAPVHVFGRFSQRHHWSLSARHRHFLCWVCGGASANRLDQAVRGAGPPAALLMKSMVPAAFCLHPVQNAFVCFCFLLILILTTLP